MLLKKIGVLVFSFMYVSVDPMDRSFVGNFQVVGVGSQIVFFVAIWF